MEESRTKAGNNGCPSRPLPPEGHARLVLFDIDGTLVNTGGAGTRAFGLAFQAAFGIANGSAGIQFQGRTDTSLVREMCARHAVEPCPENFDRFFVEYLRILEAELQPGRGAILPGVAEFIKGLKRLHPAPMIGLLTGNIREGARRKLGAFGLWDRFEMGAFSDENEDRNLIARAALQRGGEMLGQPLKGRDIVVIGDTPRDIECGRFIGARTLAVATGGATIEQLRSHQPDWAVADLREVTPAAVCGKGA